MEKQITESPECADKILSLLGRFVPWGIRSGSPVVEDLVWVSPARVLLEWEDGTFSLQTSTGLPPKITTWGVSGLWNNEVWDALIGLVALEKISVDEERAFKKWVETVGSLEHQSMRLEAIKRELVQFGYTITKKRVKKGNS